MLMNMELQFLNNSSGTSPNKSRNRGPNKNKFVGVRQRPSGKWVAEIKNTTQKIRMWLGTFDTAEEAARAYDEAAYLLRGANTRTNFLNNVPPNPALSMKIRNLLNQKRSLNKTTPSTPRIKNSELESCPKTIPSTKTVSPPDGTSISFNSNTTQSASPVCVSNPAILEDAYRPDMSCFTGGYAMCLPSYNQSCAFFTDFDKMNMLQQDGFEAQRGVGEQFPDFELMKAERQISASLYAANGISEYWDNINTSDSFWDISHFDALPNLLLHYLD